MYLFTVLPVRGKTKGGKTQVKTATFVHLIFLILF